MFRVRGSWDGDLAIGDARFTVRVEVNGMSPKVVGEASTEMFATV